MLDELETEALMVPLRRREAAALHVSVRDRGRGVSAARARQGLLDLGALGVDEGLTFPQEHEGRFRVLDAPRAAQLRIDPEQEIELPLQGDGERVDRARREGRPRVRLRRSPEKPGFSAAPGKSREKPGFRGSEIDERSPGKPGKARVFLSGSSRPAACATRMARRAPVYKC